MYDDEDVVEGYHAGGKRLSRALIEPRDATHAEFVAARALLTRTPIAQYFSQCFSEIAQSRAAEHGAPQALRHNIAVSIAHEGGRCRVAAATYNPERHEIERHEGWVDSVEQAVELLNKHMGASVKYRAGIEALRQQKHRMQGTGEKTPD